MAFDPSVTMSEGMAGYVSMSLLPFCWELNVTENLDLAEICQAVAKMQTGAGDPSHLLYLTGFDRQALQQSLDDMYTEMTQDSIEGLYPEETYM